MASNQLKSYFSKVCDEYLNGFEVIHIKQKTLFDIEHIDIYHIREDFKSIDFSFDLDLSAVKSLSNILIYLIIS